MDARDWWTLGTLLTAMGCVGVAFALMRCMTRLTRRIEQSEAQTRQVVDGRWQEIGRMYDDMIDKAKYNRDVLDSLHPTTERSA